MAAVNNGRGRGFAFQILQKQSMLRRPGQPALNHITARTPQKAEDQPIPNKPRSFKLICEQIVRLNLLANPGDSAPIALEIEASCSAPEDLERFVDVLMKCALQSKWNAHTAAMFAHAHRDIKAGSQERMLTVLLRKLQAIYEGRTGPKWSNGLEEFHLEVALMCEMFHHIRINEGCIKVLRPAIYDYFCMLLEGGTTNDIDVFVEQFPKCYPDLKELSMELLLCKLRKNIVSTQSTVEDRAKLLEVFELILTDFKPLRERAIDFYHSINLPVVRICSNSNLYKKE